MFSVGSGACEERMKANTVFACALLLAVAPACTAQVAEPLTQVPAPYPAGIVPSELNAAPEMPDAHPQLTPSGWISYGQPGCCGPLGSHGPIQAELYVHSGPSLPVAAGFLEDRLAVGWLVQGGGRSLFFDSPGIRAWTADLSLSYMFNSARANQSTFLVPVPFTNQNVFPAQTVTINVPSTVRELHRTEGTLSLGREYYLIGTALQCDGCRLRFGWDVGMRWGTTRLDLNFGDTSTFHRLNSWNYGPVIAVHSDFEYPLGCFTFIAGFRAEVDDTFNNRIQLGDDSVADVNLLLTLGLRY
jgi:hypothetical protein